jgi:hypothetical protein
MPSNIALPLSTPEPPQNVFNRLVGVSDAGPSSYSLDLDPLGIPKTMTVTDLGCLPAIDWDDDEDSGRASPERRPTSEYVFQRSKVISVPEDWPLYDIGQEWNGFVPPLPSPQTLRKPPRAF